MVQSKISKFYKLFPALLLMCALLVGSAGNAYASDSSTQYIGINFVYTDGSSKYVQVTESSSLGTYSFTVPENKELNYFTFAYIDSSNYESGTTIMSISNGKLNAAVSSMQLEQIVRSASGDSIASTSKRYGFYAADTFINVSSELSWEGICNRFCFYIYMYLSEPLVAGETLELKNFVFSNEIVQNEEVNKGILQTVEDIFTGITSLPTKIKESLTSLFDAVVSSVSALGQRLLDGFTSIFDGWYDTDVELDESLKDSWEIGSGLEVNESELIDNALSDINHIDFVGGFTGELVMALLWLLPFQDRLYNSLGLVKDVIVVALTIGLVTLVLGRGLRTLANYGGKK